MTTQIEAPAGRSTQDEASAPLVNINADDIEPLAYRILVNTCTCRQCGSISQHCQLVAEWILPPRFNMGRGVTRLTPVHEFKYNVPVHIDDRMRTQTPCCIECVSEVDLSHLPLPRPLHERLRQVVSVCHTPDGPLAKPKKKTAAENLLDIL